MASCRFPVAASSFRSSHSKQKVLLLMKLFYLLPLCLFFSTKAGPLRGDDPPRKEGPSDEDTRDIAIQILRELKQPYDPRTLEEQIHDDDARDQEVVPLKDINNAVSKILQTQYSQYEKDPVGWHAVTWSDYQPGVHTNGPTPPRHSDSHYIPASTPSPIPSVETEMKLMFETKESTIPTTKRKPASTTTVSPGSSSTPLPTTPLLKKQEPLEEESDDGLDTNIEIALDPSSTKQPTKGSHDSSSDYTS